MLDVRCSSPLSDSQRFSISASTQQPCPPHEC
jgi:hypothetical protein